MKEEEKKNDLSTEIKTIFNKNILEDLQHFLRKRQCLNATNTVFIYLFHFVQSAGILTSSIAAGTNNTDMVWIGIGLNIAATLIHVYEKTNHSMLKKLMNDIQKIKAGNYIDESEIVDIDNRQITASNENDTAAILPLLKNEANA